MSDDEKTGLELVEFRLMEGGVRVMVETDEPRRLAYNLSDLSDIEQLGILARAVDRRSLSVDFSINDNINDLVVGELKADMREFFNGLLVSAERVADELEAKREEEEKKDDS